MSGEKNNYEIFVKGGPNIASKNVKIPRGMLEYVAGKARGPGLTSSSQVCHQLPEVKCTAFLPQV